MIRSPSAAKCLGSSARPSSNEMRRVGTTRSGLLVWVAALWVLVLSSMHLREAG